MPADVSGLESLVSRMSMAQSQLKPKLGEILDKASVKFLNAVQDEIMAAENVDTRMLLSSFAKGAGNNVYELNIGSLTLNVGTNVEYAVYVNDGHSQQPGRFVPGVWSGEKFIYTPGAKTGMVLKADFVEGSHYFDNAVEAFETMFPDVVENQVHGLLASLF